MHTVMCNNLPKNTHFSSADFRERFARNRIFHSRLCDEGSEFFIAHHHHNLFTFPQNRKMFPREIRFRSQSKT